MNEVSIDISGTVVTDPVLRLTKTGTPFLSFRVAVNERRWNAQTNAWMDGDAHYFSVTAFKTLAGNAYHSVRKGQPVMVSGRLRISQYTTEKGEQRTSVQIDAQDIGVSLKFGQTTFTRCVQPDLSSLDRLADDAITAVTRRMEADGDGHEDGGAALEGTATAASANADERSLRSESTETAPSDSKVLLEV